MKRYSSVSDKVSEVRFGGVTRGRGLSRARRPVSWGVVLVLGAALIFASAASASALPVAIGGPIAVGDQPWDVSVNAVTNRAYAPNANSDTVSVINGATGGVVDTIDVGDEPLASAVNATTNRVYVANAADDSVSVIDGATGSVVDSIAVGGYPGGVAVNESTNRVYVANYYADSVSVIDGATGSVVDTVAVGAGPWTLAVNEPTNRIYVANYTGNSVSVINGATGAVIGSPITVGASPYDIAVNEASNRVYVANYNDDTVSVINGATGAVIGSPIFSGDGPGGLAVNTAANRVYVSNYNDDTVGVIDGALGSVVGTIAVGDGPWGSSFNENTNRVYVANYSADTVSVLQDTAIVSGFSPLAGPVGTSVTITGSGLTSASAVAFNGVAATSFAVDSATKITAKVPAGATSGKVSVTTVAGTSTSVRTFTVRIVTKASIAKSPNKSRVTYKRKRGVARFTLSAVVKIWGQAAVGRTVYLQSSKNGRSWKNTYKLKTSSKGRAAKLFKVKTKSVRYYRWYVPAKSLSNLKTYSKSTKVTVK